MSNSWTVADLIAVLGYFALVLVIGLWTARHVKSVDDFVLPRRFGRTLMIFFGFGTGTHADQAVSVASKSYTNGVSGIWYQWLWLFVTPFYWLIAPVMRRFRALTTADVFDLRFNRSVAMLFAIVALMQYTVNIGVMLKGSAHVIEASTGGLVDADWAIALMTVLFVAYGVAGGLHAAVLTDFIQGILTVLFSFLLLPFVLDAVGGLGGLREAVGAENMSIIAPSEIGIFYVVVLSLNGLVGIVTQPHTMANCAAGRTELDGQIGFMGGSLLKRVCTVAWTLTGVAGIAYFAARGQADINPDNVFGQLAHDFLPNVLPGLLGLFIAGLLASVMSSCDAFMIVTSGLFTENLYKPLAPGRSVRHYLWVARASAFGVVACGVIFAYRLEGVVAGLEIFWKIAPMLGIAFWLGLFWRGMTPAAAWASTLAGFGAWWLSTTDGFIAFAAALPFATPLRFVIPAGDALALYLPWQMLFYLGAGLLTGIVTSWFTRPTPPERLERFYALVRTPSTAGEVITAPCTLPPGTTASPARKLVPLRQLEIYVPSRQMVFGFLAGCGAVALLIGGFLAIIKLA